VGERGGAHLVAGGAVAAGGHAPRDLRRGARRREATYGDLRVEGPRGHGRARRELGALLDEVVLVREVMRLLIRPILRQLALRLLEGVLVLAVGGRCGGEEAVAAVALLVGVDPLLVLDRGRRVLHLRRVVERVVAADHRRGRVRDLAAARGGGRAPGVEGPECVRVGKDPGRGGVAAAGAGGSRSRGGFLMARGCGLRAAWRSSKSWSATPARGGGGARTSVVAGRWETWAGSGIAISGR
jgi:hypothetical protein